MHYYTKSGLKLTNLHFIKVVTRRLSFACGGFLYEHHEFIFLEIIQSLVNVYDV